MDENETIHQAIQTTLGGFCTRWILIADIHDTNGSSLRTLTATDMPYWDTLGLLQFAHRMVELDVESDYYATLDDDQED